MNVEQVLSLPLAETFIVEGKAPNVLGAHNMSHDALGTALGTDPAPAWALKVMNHAYDPESGGVAFHAEFVRNPNFEAEEAS